jgi:hypothetical protein
MKQPLAWGDAALRLTLLLSLAGCNRSIPGPAQETPATSAKPHAPGGRGSLTLNPSQDLRHLGLYLQRHGKGGLLPAKLEELTDLKRELPQVYQAVQDDSYVVRWGAPQSGEAIVAYERDAPSKGGVVLAGDGSVRVLSAEEFQTTAKGDK